MNKALTAAIIATAISFYGCKKDKSDDDTDPCAGATLTCTIDGASFTTTTFNNTLLKETLNGQDGYRLDIRCDVNGGNLIVSVGDWAWQNPPANGVLIKTYATSPIDTIHPPACTVINGSTICDEALGTFLITGTLENYMTSNEDDFGTITITANNTADKTVSGSFNFHAYQLGSTTVYKNIQGTFTNVCYTVLN